MILELICPGLLGPLPLSPDALPETPALDRLLARSDVRERDPTGVLTTLAARFGVAAPPGGDLPSAPLSLAGESPYLDSSGFWLHADPVHLHPDRDRLLLFAGPSLDVTRDELAVLAERFNAHFSAEGLSLLVTESGSCYLHAARAPRLGTHPIHSVSGRAIDAFLPSGPDARDWIRWQNEAQMLFFDHPVNLERERRGAPSIGGLWTWGGGVMPRVQTGPELVVSDHPLALGLAGRAGVRACSCDELGGALDESAQTRSALAFWDRLWWPALEGDTDAWCAGLAALELVAAGLIERLKDGRVRMLVLDDGISQRFESTRGSLLRFWRRGGGLSDRMRSG